MRKEEVESSTSSPQQAIETMEPVAVAATHLEMSRAWLLVLLQVLHRLVAVLVLVVVVFAAVLSVAGSKS